MIQGPQLIIVLAIVLLLFGGSKLPKLARSLGQAQKEFRDGLKEGQDEPDQATPPPANASTVVTPPAIESPRPAPAPVDPAIEPTVDPARIERDSTTRSDG